MMASWSGGGLLHADTPPVRERVSLDDHWQFIHDDPADAAGKLKYGNVKADVEVMGADLAEPFAETSALSALPSSHVGEDVAHARADFDDQGWQTVNLPHDWGIEGPFDQAYPGDTGKLPWWGVGWYRKHFSLPKADESRQVFLQIDGAMSYSMVWLHGHFLGGWPYGYTSYQVELTPYLIQEGENVIAIAWRTPKRLHAGIRAAAFIGMCGW